MIIRVQEDVFDAGAELTAFTKTSPEVGAVVTFTGIVRDVPGGLQGMEIEHYPGMTTKAITGTFLEKRNDRCRGVMGRSKRRRRSGIRPLVLTLTPIISHADDT